MTILRYDPWHSMVRLHRQIDQILGDAFAAPTASAEDTGGDGSDRSPVDWIPAVDVHEEADKFVLTADLPGVSSGDISVTADKGVLTLSGRRPARTAEQQRGFARVERAGGSFRRRFTLPENVNADDIRARHANGVLEVLLPKVPAAQPRRVAVEVH